MSLAATILERRTYFDAVTVWTERDEDDRGRLAPHCRHIHVSPPGRRGPLGLDARLQLYQPTIDALVVLRDIARARMTAVNRLEAALDLLTGSQAEAEGLYEYLDAHLVQLWHGAEPVMYFKGTRYTRRRRWNSRQLAMYADGSAAQKNDGRPTCHLELRANGAKQVRGLGVCTPADLPAFDHRALWRRFMILEEPRPLMIGRQSRNRSRAKRPDLQRYRDDLPLFDADRRSAALLLRGAASRMSGATAQDVRDHLHDAPWFRPATSMRRLNSDAFLPAGEPHLMKVQQPTLPSHTPIAANESSNSNPQKAPSHA